MIYNKFLKENEDMINESMKDMYKYKIKDFNLNDPNLIVGSEKDFEQGSDLKRHYYDNYKYENINQKSEKEIFEEFLIKCTPNENKSYNY